MLRDDSASIDWDAVWQSLDWGQERRSQTIQARLAERAERYALPPEDEEGIALDAIHALVFRRGKEQFAMPVSGVAQSLAAPPITAVPCTPAFYRGVIHLRGRMISVLDLARFWRVPTEDPPTPQVLIVHAAGLHVALLADDLIDVRRIPLQDITPPAADVAMNHVRGITPEGIVILDADTLLQDPRLIVHEDL